MTSDEDAERLPPRKRLGVGAAIAVVLIGLAITVAIGVIRGATMPVEAVRIDEGAPSGSATVAASDGLFVHVSGAVTEPGLYLLTPGSRVIDAIAAAGGFAEQADESAINLARPLSDGEQLVVAAVGDPPPTGVADPARGDGRVNLNTAGLDELDTLPRIGPAMAQRILDWRESNGGFTSVEDLLAVPGIGDKMLESLRDLVSI